MKCKLTGMEGKGVNAHIIPRSFFRIDPEEKELARIYTNKEGEYPKRAPKGVYDSSIVVEEGERVFSGWDDYAAELLITNVGNFLTIYDQGETIGYQLKEYDYQSLKLFFLSVLWRAAVSSHPFYDRVKLGPHLEIIRDLLLRGNLDNSEPYDVVLARWHGEEDTGMLNPHRNRFEGLNYYLIYMDRYVAYIKVDKCKATGLFGQAQLIEGSPLLVIGRNPNESKERDLMLRIFRS